MDADADADEDDDGVRRSGVVEVMVEVLATETMDAEGVDAKEGIAVAEVVVV